MPRDDVISEELDRIRHAAPMNCGTSEGVAANSTNRNGRWRNRDLSEGDGFRASAMHNAPPAYEEARAGVLYPPPSTSLSRAANTKQAVQIADVTLERGYIEGDPFNVSAVALGGYRSVFSVPMCSTKTN